MKNKGDLTHLVVSSEKEEKRINKLIAKRSAAGAKKKQPKKKMKDTLKEYFKSEIAQEYDPENAQLSELNSLDETHEESQFEAKRLFNEFEVSQEYRGEPMSRQQMYAAEEESESQEYVQDQENEMGHEIEGSSQEEQSQEGESEEDGRLEQQIEQLEMEDQQALNEMQEMNQDEKEKSQAIRNQYTLHQNLISLRLTRVEQLLLSANQLPSNYSQNEAFQKLTKSSENTRKEINGKIYQIINKLVNRDEQQEQEESLEDENVWRKIQQFDQPLQKECNQTIQRWHRKVQLSSRNVATDLKKINSTVPAQVQFLIDSHRPRLLKKTQIPPAQGIFKEFIDQSDVFNDRELFLMQMKDWGGLEEISKGMSEVDLIMEIRKAQKRSNKLGKVVDTKASKGRKLRFTVHNKLVNFMTPIEGDDEVEQNLRLLDSLFGVMREQPVKGSRVKEVEEEQQILATSGVTLI